MTNRQTKMGVARTKTMPPAGQLCYVRSKNRHECAITDGKHFWRDDGTPIKYPIMEWKPVFG